MHFTVNGRISPVPQGAELWLGAMSDGGWPAATG
jgi:hypothetical protein